MSSTPTLVTLATPRSVDPNRAIRIQRAHDYPVQIWILLTCFLGILTFCHLGVLLVFRQRKRRASAALSGRNMHKESSGDKPITYNANHRLSVRRTPFAILTSFRILMCRVTIPIGEGNVLNGAEVGIIAGYIAALFTWEFINCMNVRSGDKLDVSYWANRAACIVRSQFPLLVALASKNNIISLLTGISYEKLNVLHRAAARVCLVLIWVHFWGRVRTAYSDVIAHFMNQVFDQVKEGLAKDLDLWHPWVRTGIMAATAYTLLVLISFRPLRSRYYEFFFFSHFVLVLIILIGAYFHMRRGFGIHSFSEVGPYLIPTFAIWALDRSLRLLNVLRNNRASYVTPKSAGALDAMVEVLSPSMVRVALKRKMTWRAGQSAFLTIPSVSNIPVEAHPFTIASISKRKDFLGSKSGDSSKEGNMGEDKTLNELVFLICVKKGFTRRLQEAAERHDNSRLFPWSVYVDGPYGSPPDLSAFQNVILIAGGSGVSYTLPMLQQIVSDANFGGTVCSSVLFIWAIPHRAQFSWIANAIDETLEAAPQALNIRIRVHVTQEASAEGNSSFKTAAPDTNKQPDTIMYKLLHGEHVSLEVGRPNVHALLEDELLCADRHVSVDVAGPAGLAADVRRALSSEITGPLRVLKGRPDVTLHVETYGIA